MNKTKRPRFLSTVSLLAVLLPSPAPAAERALSNALPPGHASCHARVLNAGERADPERRIISMALDRNLRDIAMEKKWGALEQFDGTPVVSATLRVRQRGDPVAHDAHLECALNDDGGLSCTTPACSGGELRIAAEGLSGIAISIGGKLKNGRFIRHYIHLDDSCEGRGGGPLVLEQGEDERSFILAPAPKEACR